MNKILSTPLIIGLVLMSGVAHAQSNNENMVTSAWALSVNGTATTDYIFRGVSQSDENMALQLGADIAHDNGLYAGIWGSNVDFNDGDEADVEVDIYAGYGWAWHDVQFDLSAIYYLYPGADDALDYDYAEAALAIGYDFGDLSTEASFYYSPDFFGTADDGYYSHLNVSYPVYENITVHAATGYQSLDSGTDYQDWQLGVAYAWNDVELFVNYHDTDLQRGDCADGCEARVVFGASFAFDVKS